MNHLDVPTLQRRQQASELAAIESKMLDEELAAALDTSVSENVTMPVPSALAIQEGGSHYKNLRIQPAEYNHANGMPFIEGNVVKYVTRWRSKGEIKDLRKARHFLDILIELEMREQ